MASGRTQPSERFPPFDEGEWDEAQRALDRLFIAFPTYERTPEARMLLAQSYFNEEQYLTAASEYARFVDRFPGHPSAPDAALGRCRASAAQSPVIQRDQSATEVAVVVCGNVVADYQGTTAATEAGKIAEEMRLKLAEKLKTTGVEVILVYPGQEHPQYRNSAAYLIDRLKK